MRQKIIEQRKQRINNATQRFQRSHLPPPPPPPPPPPLPPPPPQRCMQCEQCICTDLSLTLKKRCLNLSAISDVSVRRINVPTVEEALVEIQSKLDSCNFQSSISTSNYRKRRYGSSQLDLHKYSPADYE